MNRLVRNAGWVLLSTVIACAKKEPKPMRTEPWLAHPSASASATAAGSAGAELPFTRYLIASPSVLRWEAVARGASARGTLTHLSGEVSVDFSNLGRSRALIQAELASLIVEEPEGDAGALLGAQIRRALDLDEGGTAATPASFDLTSLEELPAELEAMRAGSPGAPLTRRLRATAIGNLLLHGFRVVRRVPVEAEFEFAGGSATANRLVIRSRAPVVISLETHAITLPAPELPRKAGAGARSAPRDVRLSVELYATKVD